MAFNMNDLLAGNSNKSGGNQSKYVMTEDTSKPARDYVLIPTTELAAAQLVAPIAASEKVGRYSGSGKLQGDADHYKKVVPPSKMKSPSLTSAEKKAYAQLQIQLKQYLQSVSPPTLTELERKSNNKVLKRQVDVLAYTLLGKHDPDGKVTLTGLDPNIKEAFNRFVHQTKNQVYKGRAQNMVVLGSDDHPNMWMAKNGIATENAVLNTGNKHGAIPVPDVPQHQVSVLAKQLEARTQDIQAWKQHIGQQTNPKRSKSNFFSAFKSSKSKSRKAVVHKPKQPTAAELEEERLAQEAHEARLRKMMEEQQKLRQPSLQTTSHVSNNADSDIQENTQSQISKEQLEQDKRREMQQMMEAQRQTQAQEQTYTEIQSETSVIQPKKTHAHSNQQDVDNKFANTPQIQGSTPPEHEQEDNPDVDGITSNWFNSPGNDSIQL